jgi:hypothetical protein
MKNRYINQPSFCEIVCWVAMLLLFFWILFWGLNYILQGVVWLTSFI